MDLCLSVTWEFGHNCMDVCSYDTLWSSRPKHFSLTHTKPSSSAHRRSGRRTVHVPFTPCHLRRSGTSRRKHTPNTHTHTLHQHAVCVVRCGCNGHGCCGRSNKCHLCGASRLHDARREQRGPGLLCQADARLTDFGACTLHLQARCDTRARSVCFVCTCPTFPIRSNTCNISLPQLFL